MPNDVVFNHNGPDIVASARGITWKFECKGFGTGKNSTHKNHFDRAISSAVSYFDSPDTRLGLALADLAGTSKLPETQLKAILEASGWTSSPIEASGLIVWWAPEKVLKAYGQEAGL